MGAVGASLTILSGVGVWSEETFAGVLGVTSVVSTSSPEPPQPVRIKLRASSRTKLALMAIRVKCFVMFLYFASFQFGRDLTQNLGIADSRSRGTGQP